jgi:UDP-N-acetylglucosamine--N-acetylmuramyl-(pentapeptide) pyrophosphoryl-undecaprenol N-acetylglucosamine transferase
MSSAAKPPASVVIAGGHSAGHIEPAMAVADALRRIDPALTITALGTHRGLDTTLIPVRGYPLELIDPAPLPRRISLAALGFPRKLAVAIRQAGQVLDRVDADVVVGFGGYVAQAMYLAARRRKIPIVVHEANARPGVANRIAARLTKYVFTASDQVQLPHAHPIGIPLRPSISTLDRPALRASARDGFGLRADRPTLLVTGGSQGAQAINAAVAGAAADLAAAGIQVLHIVGPKNDPRPPPGADDSFAVLPYVDDMRLAYAAADFVICRSGAMTCAELAAVGLPAAYVPLPLRGGEQRLNAEPVVAQGGGLMVSNADFSAPWIVANVIPLLTDPARLAEMARAAHHAGLRDADMVLAQVTRDIAADHRAGRNPKP